MAEKSSILGPDGRPLLRTEEKVTRKFASFGALSTYAQSLGSLRLSATQRAQDPFSNHPWIFSAARAIAIAASQAPYTIMRDTELRDDRAGEKRRALARRIMAPTLKRLVLKGAEPATDHPLTELFTRPNLLMDGAQLFHYTYMWLAVRSEIFWYIGDDGSGERTIWPVPPDHLQPMWSSYDRGSLIGWELRPPRWMPLSEQTSRVELDLRDVIQFKVCSPGDPTRGMASVTPVAQAVETDLLSKQHTSALLRNRAVPKGILTYKYALQAEEEEEFKRRWREQFEGVDNAEKTALLHGGWDYQTVGASADDLGLSDREDRNREEILGVMGTPGSVVGLTNDLNYATQLGQDRNFWDKTVIPMFQLVERAIESSDLMYTETDAIFGAHDLRNIEALRVGVAEKITMANNLAGNNLRVPPRVAFEVVDLSVPQYDQDDESTYSLENPVDQVDPTLPTGPRAALGEKPPAAKTLKGKNAKRDKILRLFNERQTTLENRASRIYASWIGGIGEKVERNASRVFKAVTDYQVLLPDFEEDVDELLSEMSGVGEQAVQDAYDLTELNAGIPVFDMDDELIISYLNAREKRMRTFASKGIAQNVRRALEAAATNGETAQQTRDRLARLFRLSTSSAKVRTWARTETSGMINGLRDRMFDAQGIEKSSWSNANDEHVRADHVRFGNAGPKKRGFNYLTLVGRSGEGQLRYAGDEDGPVDQIVNCRCTNLAE